VSVELHVGSQLDFETQSICSFVICHYNKRTMRSLRQCLLDTDLIRLQVIAHFWDVELTTSRRQEVATQLTTAMAAPEAIADAWDALPGDQCQALDALLAAGGRMPLRVFARQWGEIRAMGPGRLEREQPWRDPISPAEGLWYKGFISRAFDPEAGETYEVVFVPPELRVHLPAPPGRLPAIALESAPEPATVHSAGDILLDDACTLLAYLQNEQVRPDSDGNWPARHEVRLAQRLHDPNPVRLAWLHHLTHHLGWLRVTNSVLLRPDPGPVAAWLKFPTGQQRSVLAESWRSDPTWNDLFHVPTICPEDTGAWRNDPLLARKAILRHLKACTPDTWYKLDDFAAAVKQTDPDFQRPDGDYTTWYVRNAATGVYLSGFESWDEVEGALIRYLVTGPLAWLGLIDLGTDLGTGQAPLVHTPIPQHPSLLHSAFRLTSAGAAFLGVAEPPPEPEPAVLVLRLGFTVLVPPTRRYERFQLARVADWVHTGDPFVYRITPTSLKRARGQGIPVARVLEFLDQVTGPDTPVPRFVEAALTRWDARGAEAWLEQVLLLRLSSEELMVQITSSPRTRHLVREQIGPTAALVRERDWPRLVAALSEMGLLADVIGLEETAARNHDWRA
jgi:hypothetical protein